MAKKGKSVKQAVVEEVKKEEVVVEEVKKEEVIEEVVETMAKASTGVVVEEVKIDETDVITTPEVKKEEVKTDVITTPEVKKEEVKTPKVKPTAFNRTAQFKQTAIRIKSSLKAIDSRPKYVEDLLVATVLRKQRDVFFTKVSDLENMIALIKETTVINGVTIPAIQKEQTIDILLKKNYKLDKIIRERKK